VILTETRLKGACIIERERREDERGFFARSFRQREFEEYGMNPVKRYENTLALVALILPHALEVRIRRPDSTKETLTTSAK
jgi:dTDP-4-dehydrorhamnose 3,5-epimerase